MKQDKTLIIDMPEQVKTILGILHRAGHEAYIVGGCVRDALLGRKPGDWDITTSALPSEVKSLFYHTVDTGIQHGTVMVLMGGEGFEVTTYRKDGKYSDHRRPDEVVFTPSLAEDLKRRDFTINAFAYDPKSGITDLFDGLTDLDNGIIRCVGDADTRFSEDALRIMRAVRFAAQLSFKIEPETKQAVKTHAKDLSAVSMERIRVEFEKTLMSDHPEYVNLYRELGLAEHIIRPKRLFERCFREDSVPIYKALAAQEDQKRLRYLRLAAFLKELSPVEAVEVLKDLTYDNKTKDAVRSILQWKEEPLPPDRIILKQALRRMGAEVLQLVWAYKTAVLDSDSSGKIGEMHCFAVRDETMLKDAVELTEEILASGEPYQLSMLAVSGNDLMEAGIREGAEVGRILNALLDLVIKQPACNQKEILLEQAVRL